jgi:endonuclease YncB( thermonuclease family)
MRRQIATSKQYAHLRKAIGAALLCGAERVRRSYREEVVRTTWDIGRILRRQLGLGDTPSPGNAGLIARLTRDFDRPDSYFYDAAKFHRLYPSKAPVALSLAHYSLLIRFKDPQKRLALEKKALSEGMNSKDLKIYVRTLLRSGLEFKSGAVSGSERTVLPVERGCLYHYRAANAPADGRMLLDIGFGIERDVRCNDQKSFHSGLIVRAVRTGEDYTSKISPYDKNRLYTYAASLVRVIDGDTLIARVDLGFRTWITETFRLRGIDSPELTCALGQKAKAEVVARLKPCACLVIKTYKQEKFGRFLADVFYRKEAGDDREQILREGAFLNQELLDEGLAVPYDGES